MLLNVPGYCLGIQALSWVSANFMPKCAVTTDSLLSCNFSIKHLLEYEDEEICFWVVGYFWSMSRTKQLHFQENSISIGKVWRIVGKQFTNHSSRCKPKHDVQNNFNHKMFSFILPNLTSVARKCANLWQIKFRTTIRICFNGDWKDKYWVLKIHCFMLMFNKSPKG